MRWPWRWPWGWLRNSRPNGRAAKEAIDKQRAKLAEAQDVIDRARRDVHSFTAEVQAALARRGPR
jgi:hypothetical protein